MTKKVFSCSNPECDKEFERYESTVRNSARVYCSPECRRIHMKTFFKGENNPNWKGGIGQQFETEKLMKSLMTEETVKAIENIAKTVRSYSEIAREVGVPRSTVKRLMEKHEIPRLPPAPVFEVSDTRRNSTVRKAILDGDRSSYVCECGQGPEWNGKPLVLQLDHINGDAYDNRLENLRFLCPNCHTQTDTFCGRNR